ncbi:MAG TPA: hypothetical protein ENI60_07470 [Candidatus Fraserbacteria bacterium]|nr:hypothetical protein [Candidatus Fraserbacteria bacterium]
MIEIIRIIFLLATVAFGGIGLVFFLFGVLGLAFPRENVQYSERELLWMALAGAGDLVAAALLVAGVLSGSV